MKDATFSATLKAAKLTARKDPNNPDTIIRRVQFQLSRDFDIEQAEWLGEGATKLRTSLQGRDLNRFELPINGYHAKASFHGMAGNATVEALDGLTATAAVVGSDEDEHEEITFVFEAFPEAKLLTFLAMALKEHIECEFQALQLELTDTIEKFKESLAPFDKVTVKVGGGPEVVLRGSSEEPAGPA